ncbi:MAG: four helix bundle protein, partial [Patescibacteria group bacterium]
GLNLSLPVLNKMLDAYKKWQTCMISIPKIYRYSLGLRIDNLFLDVVENMVLSLSLGKESRVDSLNYVSVKLDLLKFLLKISWELKIFDTKKYIDLSLSVDEVGRMLGGWIKNTKKVV